MITQRRRTNLASFNISRLLVSVLLLLSLGGIAAADEAGESLKVDRLTFPVTLANGSAAEVVGYLYDKGSSGRDPRGDIQPQILGRAHHQRARVLVRGLHGRA
jgi:hypothetical protein